MCSRNKSILRLDSDDLFDLVSYFAYFIADKSIRETIYYFFSSTSTDLFSCILTTDNKIESYYRVEYNYTRDLDYFITFSRRIDRLLPKYIINNINLFIKNQEDIFINNINEMLRTGYIKHPNGFLRIGNHYVKLKTDYDVTSINNSPDDIYNELDIILNYNKSHILKTDMIIIILYLIDFMNFEPFIRELIKYFNARKNNIINNINSSDKNEYNQVKDQSMIFLNYYRHFIDLIQDFINNDTLVKLRNNYENTKIEITNSLNDITVEKNNINSFYSQIRNRLSNINLFSNIM